MHTYRLSFMVAVVLIVIGCQKEDLIDAPPRKISNDAMDIQTDEGTDLSQRSFILNDRYRSVQLQSSGIIQFGELVGREITLQFEGRYKKRRWVNNVWYVHSGVLTINVAGLHPIELRKESLDHCISGFVQEINDATWAPDHINYQYRGEAHCPTNNTSFGIILYGRVDRKGGYSKMQVIVSRDVTTSAHSSLFAFVGPPDFLRIN